MVQVKIRLGDLTRFRNRWVKGTRLSFYLTLASVLCLFNAACSSAPTLSPNGITAGLPQVDEPPFYRLDRVGETPEPFSKQPIQISSAGDIHLNGFAVDRAAQYLAGGVDVAIDGLPFTAHYGLLRQDVADYFKVPSYSRSGFSFSIPARYFGSGRHKLAVRVISNDRTKYIEGPTLDINIV